MRSFLGEDLGGERACRDGPEPARLGWEFDRSTGFYFHKSLGQRFAEQGGVWACVWGACPRRPEVGGGRPWQGLDFRSLGTAFHEIRREWLGVVEIGFLSRIGVGGVDSPNLGVGLPASGECPKGCTSGLESSGAPPRRVGPTKCAWQGGQLVCSSRVVAELIFLATAHRAICSCRILFGAPVRGAWRAPRRPRSARIGVTRRAPRRMPICHAWSRAAVRGSGGVRGSGLKLGGMGKRPWGASRVATAESPWP